MLIKMSWGLAALLGVLPTVALAAEPPACGCVEAFDSLVQKVEANYIGFHMSLPTLDRARYEASKAAFRRTATAASDEDCFLALRPYVKQFHDEHLFISEQQPALSVEEQARLAAAAETLPWTEESLRAYLDRNAGKLDPVEGIWYAENARFGIVRDRQLPRRDFVAILLSGGSGAWKPGQVKAELKSRADGSFDVRYFYGDYSLHHLEGTIYKGLLLRMAPVMWGKAYPVRPADAGLLDAQNPRNPTIKSLGNGAWVVSMPSHDGPYREPLERLIAAHLEQLRAARLIIVDLRGNEGGSAHTSHPLVPFYESAQTQPRRTYSGKEVVVSAPDQIAYFQGIVQNMEPGSAWHKRGQALVERMQREPGKVLVTDVWGNPPEPPPAHPPAYPKPEHFAILIDRGAVSAAEAFVLAAWKSKRVTVFGDRSAGSIDYQSVYMVPLACPSRGLMLGYPTLGSSEHLPAGGFNAEGIPPDVRIGPEVADPIQFIVEHYGGAR